MLDRTEFKALQVEIKQIQARQRALLAEFNQEGRNTMLIFNGFVSIAVYSPFLRNTFGNLEGNAVLGATILAGGVGAIIPVFTTRNVSIPKQVAQFTTYGQSRPII